MADRDRDDTGRPRNTRPRDELGRPLPDGRVGVARMPDDLELSAAETLIAAQDLLDRGLAFNAHEVFEAAWKNGPSEERELWQGLAQLAVGITHLQRGNVAGALAVLRRASIRLTEVGRPAPHEVDAEGLVAHTAGVIDGLASGSEISAEQLRPRLTRRCTSDI